MTQSETAVLDQTPDTAAAEATPTIAPETIAPSAEAQAAPPLFKLDRPASETASTFAPADHRLDPSVTLRFTFIGRQASAATRADDAAARVGAKVRRHPDHAHQPRKARQHAEADIHSRLDALWAELAAKSEPILSEILTLAEELHSRG